MNREETLALYKRGRKAWNEWAKEKLEKRDDSETWRDSSRVDFTGHKFNATDELLRTLDQQRRVKYSSMPVEAKMLLEPFRRKNQDSDALEVSADLPPFIDFIGFIFPGDALFTNAHFLCDANFGDTDFRGRAVFNGTVFHGLLVFSGNLHESLVFNRAKFVGQAFFPGLRLEDDSGPLPDRVFAFNNTIFKQDASFSESVFPSSRVMFRKAMFEGDADFMEASFNGSALFDWAVFKGRAMFHKTTYKSSVQFIEARFEGDTDFGGASFHRNTYFKAVRVKSVFTMAGSEFLEVPDFGQATFVQAPRLDNVKIEPPCVRNISAAAVKTFFKGDLEKEGRWRALKRLAVQGHDHMSERRFFREELLARRGVTDRYWHAPFWLGVFYQLFSDFGRSLSRPLLWWIGGIMIFAAIYLGYHPGVGEWLLSECVKGTGKPWIAALGLSLHKSLPALSSFGDKLPAFYACLYGANSENPFRPIIPDVVSFLGVPQVLFSAVMIFLFMLAVRNHFKIK